MDIFLEQVKHSFDVEKAPNVKKNFAVPSSFDIFA
jgi:hypothetical protein